MDKDTKWYDFYEDNCRYADIINGGIFQGEQIVSQADLTEVDTRLKKKQRDIVRKVAWGVNFSIVGLENQETIDYALPARIMEYDALQYSRQVRKIRKKIGEKKAAKSSDEFLNGFRKYDRLYPVITLVLYTGKKPWDGPNSLKGILTEESIPKKLMDMVQDYKVYVIDIKRLRDTSVFKTDVKEVFDFIQCTEDKEALMRLINNNEYYQNMRLDAFEIIKEYSNAKGLAQIDKYKTSTGRINMCKAIEDLMDDSRGEGRREGRREGHIEALNEAIRLFVETLRELQHSEDTIILKLIQKFHISEKDAKKWVEKVS